MLTAVLVDLDGTLIQTADANAAAYATALAEWGIAVDRGALAPLIDGRNWRDFLPGLIGTRSDVSAEAVALRKRELYSGFFPLIQLNDLLLDLLRRLQGTVKLALVTTASARAVADLGRQFDFFGMFDLTVTGDDVQHHKPHPEAYVLAASRLSVAAGECLVIEDSEIGAAAARAFGGGLLRWTAPRRTGPEGRA